MQTPVPFTRDLVLVGGGHAHALVLRKWGMSPLPGVRVTLVNPGPTAPYTGMLPGHIAGHYSRDDLDIDLVRLARFAGARLILDQAVGLDPDAQTITLKARGALAYDVASLDIGITSQMPRIPGFADHAVAAKPLDSYTARWRDFLTGIAGGTQAASVIVIGGGVAGVELTLAMAHALRQISPDYRVTLLESAPGLTGTGRAARQRLLAALASANISLRTGVDIDRITAEGVVLATGETLPAGLVVGAAGATPQDWLQGNGLQLHEGYVTVDGTLRAQGHDTLFAVGDCAHLSHAPRPKAGVYAVRAAPVLHDNLRAALSGRPLRTFHPQKDYLKLISLGDQAALAEKYRLPFSGRWLWRLKDRIDRKFMTQFTDLPAMAASAPPPQAALGVAEELAGGKPLCGGCGSKLGSDSLAQALTALPQSRRDDILSGPGDDAAVLSVGGARQVVTTDHLRAFTEDAALLAQITAVHAMGDIWSMGARPQAALATVILPRMSAPLQTRSLREILQAASAVFAAEGAEIVGGHSTMGAELTIGFTVTGLCATDAITQAGARPGDALILTRPIGSGTILAAEMAGQARGGDVANLLQRMRRPQGDAARILQEAHAMTDVTGFGLAGHLAAMCRASDVGAEVHLDAIPLYAGALELAAAGHRSTLYAANLSSAPIAGCDGPRAALLHDPQTAGGLLAAVSQDRADHCLHQLLEAGHEAAIIGSVTAAAGLRCV